MASHGKLEQFHVGQEDWDTYEECLQQYFVANNVEGAEKQRTILSVCGQATYRVIQNPVGIRCNIRACCVPNAYFMPYAYGTYRMCTVCTMCVWYVFLYHTHMVVLYVYMFHTA